jgi:hypothetical protein
MLSRRLIREDLTFEQVDQLEIARALVDHAQDRLGGDLRIDTTPDFCGVLRDRSYEATGRKPIWEALTELAAVQDGFEQRMVPYWQGDAIRWRYETGYPEIGRTADETGHVLDYQEGWPGSGILEYTWPSDASMLTNVADVVGEQVVGTAENPDAWSRYARLEQSWSHVSVSQQETVEQHADAYLTAYGEITPLVQAELRADRYRHNLPQVGDHVRLRLTSGRHPARGLGTAGLDEDWRVIERQITAPNRGDVEKVRVTLDKGLEVSPRWE